MRSRPLLLRTVGVAWAVWGAWDAGAGRVGPAAARGALAQAAGGSGYSGTLSSNAVVRRQQLICDPAPGTGSTSVAYNPALVSMTGFTYGPGYDKITPDPEQTQGYVEVRHPATMTSPPSAPFLINIENFFFDQQTGMLGNLQETGYVQISYRVVGTPGQIDPTVPMFGGSGPYTIMDERSAGTGGGHVDTHEFQFTFLSNTPNDAAPQYTIYADDGTRGQGADFLTIDTTTITAAQIAPVTVTAPLPEPSSAAAAGLAAAAWLLRRRGRPPYRR